MYRKSYSILLLLAAFFFGYSLFGQVPERELLKLKEQLSEAQSDSSILIISGKIASGYRFSNIDSALYYSNKALKIAKKLSLQKQEAILLSLIGAIVLESGKLPESLSYQFEALGLGTKLGDTQVTADAQNRIGNVYMELADYPKAIEYYRKSQTQFKSIQDTGMYYNEISNIGNVYALMEVPDSAIYFQNITYIASLSSNDRQDFTFAEIMFRYGNAFLLNHNIDSALHYYRKGIMEARFDNDLRNLAMTYHSIAKLYFELDNADSAMNYAQYAIETAEQISFKKVIYESSILISDLFKSNEQYKEALYYLTSANEIQEKIAGSKRLQDLQRIILDEKERQREANIKRLAIESRNQLLAVLTGTGVLLLIGVILIRNNRQKQKANHQLQQSILSLKSTQTQLIHSEKMASLGELTAGIAHEIQNPLNFVNNFSDLNKELIDEQLAELEKGDIDEAKIIADDIKTNESKINHHGKRAEEIVKSMLQHSRSGSGKKELTDINLIADEYLRLAYHGLRAKDKSFNADFKADLDPSLPKIEVVPQDIGRVLLNLINNAFQAVKEVEKPKVIVSTKLNNKQIVIQVKDNGSGIPDEIKDKIFQPFFTTKAAGEGTGLGLSMSYDIITKGHNGELILSTNKEQGTEFTIILPLNNLHNL